MKTLQISAFLYDSAGQPVSGAKVRLEAFQLASNTWTVVTSGITAKSGELNLSVAFGTAEPFAPFVRLCEDQESNRVIAQQGVLSYNARSQILLCDFGHLELLGDTAFAMTATQSTLSKLAPTIAGEHKRPVVATSDSLRTLKTSTVNLNVEKIQRVNDSLVAANKLPDLEKIQTDSTLPPYSSSLDVFNSELIKFRAMESQLQFQLSAKDRIILSKDEEISAAKLQTEKLMQESKELQSELQRVRKVEDALRKSEEALRKENETYTSEKDRLNPIQSIAANIGAEVAAANQRLRTEKQPYQIQNIQVELRGTLSQDGQSINLLRMAELRENLASAALLRMDIGTTAPAPAQTSESKVPDVTGLTESLARRLLSAARLNMEVVKRSVGLDSPHTIGQAIAQSPAAGSPADPNKPILVVFAVE